MATVQELLTKMTIAELEAIDLSTYDADSAALVRRLQARKEPTVAERVHAVFKAYVSKAGPKYRKRAARRKTQASLASDRVGPRPQVAIGLAVPVPRGTRVLAEDDLH